MQDFKKLKVWQKSHQLTLAVYKVTRTFPKDELYGMTSQIRRCSVSIPANIAEGCGRGGGADFVRFLTMSMGSASELEYHLLLSHDLGFLNADQYQQRNSDITEIKRMLTSLIRKLKTDK